jgi:hypothetical protein
MRRWVTALLGVALVSVVPLAAADAQETPGAQAIGTTIAGTLVPPGGRPAFVFAFRLPPELQGNVTGLDCGAGGRIDLAGGPGRSPECLFGQPQPVIRFVITGSAPWPAGFPIAPQFSFDDRTYQPGDPVVVQAAPPASTAPPPTPAATVPTTVPTTVAVAPSTTAAPTTTLATTTVATTATSAVATTTPALTGSDGGSSLRLLWGLVVLGGVGAVGAGIALRRRQRDGGGDDREDLVDLIFSSPEVTVPALSTADCDRRWREAMATEAQHQSELVGALQETLQAFVPAWSDAMAELDTYREESNVLLGQSAELRGMVDAWADERAGYERADFAVALVSLAVSLPSLLRSLPALAKSLYSLSRATLGLPWRIAAAVRAAQLARAAERWATTIDAVVGEGYLQAKAVAQAQAMVGEAMAAEVGADFARVYAECGGRPGLSLQQMTEVLRKASDRLYWEVFRARGWVLFKESGKLPSPLTWVATDAQALYKGVLTTVYGTSAPDPFVVLTRLIANAHVALREGRAVSSFASWSQDLQALQAMAADPAFFSHLEHAVTEIESAGWVGWQHQEAMTVTVRCFDANDLALLRALVEGKGDPARVAQLLGPATTTVVQAEGGLLQWLTRLKRAGITLPVPDAYLAHLTAAAAAGAAGPSPASLVSAVGPGLPQDPIDLVHLTDTFGITTHGYLGGFWHGTKGFFTAPITTIGEVNRTAVVHSAAVDFVTDHGPQLLHLGSLLDGAIGALDRAGGALRHSRLAHQLDDKRRRLPADLDELGRILGGCGADAGWRDAHEAELRALHAEVDQKLETVERIGEQLAELASMIDTLRGALRAARTAEGGNAAALHPATLAKVDAARLALLGMMSGLRAVSLPPGVTSPEGTVLTRQQRAELRSYDALTSGSEAAPPSAVPPATTAPGTPVADAPRWPPTWQGVIDSLGRPGDTVITESAVPGIVQGLLPDGVALPPVSVDRGIVTVTLPSGPIHATLVVHDGELDVASASEHVPDAVVRMVLGDRLAELNRRVRESGQRVTAVVGDGGDLRITTGPR